MPDSWKLEAAARFRDALEPGHGFGFDDLRVHRMFRYDAETGLGHRHRLTQTTRPGVQVDEKMLDLIEALWASGYDTTHCCQCSDISPVGPVFYVIFTSLEDAYQFMVRTLTVIPSDCQWKVELTSATDGRGHIKVPVDYLQATTELWSCASA